MLVALVVAVVVLLLVLVLVLVPVVVLVPPEVVVVVAPPLPPLVPLVVVEPSPSPHTLHRLRSVYWGQAASGLRHRLSLASHSDEHTTVLLAVRV